MPPERLLRCISGLKSPVQLFQTAARRIWCSSTARDMYGISCSVCEVFRRAAGRALTRTRRWSTGIRIFGRSAPASPTKSTMPRPRRSRTRLLRRLRAARSTTISSSRHMNTAVYASRTGRPYTITRTAKQRNWVQPTACARPSTRRWTGFSSRTRSLGLRACTHRWILMR